MVVTLLAKLSKRSHRISLNTGGNDITEFLYVLLERINFPYRSIDLARWHDWLVMEDLKARLCTLAEVGEPFTGPGVTDERG